MRKDAGQDRHIGTADTHRDRPRHKLGTEIFGKREGDKERAREAERAAAAKGNQRQKGIKTAKRRAKLLFLGSASDPASPSTLRTLLGVDLIHTVSAHALVS